MDWHLYGSISEEYHFVRLLGTVVGNRALRERVSQAVLAHHLNVGTKLVSDWERGVKRPSGPSLKLLALVRAKGLDAIA